MKRPAPAGLAVLASGFGWRMAFVYGVSFCSSAAASTYNRSAVFGANQKLKEVDLIDFITYSIEYRH